MTLSITHSLAEFVNWDKVRRTKEIEFRVQALACAVAMGKLKFELSTIMPDIRRHRGAHPEDRKLFAEGQVPVLRAAVGELSWLLTRDYSLKGALKLVGDRYTLTDRQRLAVARAACSDQSKERRGAALINAAEVADEGLIVDGFNLIITVEAALSG